MVLCLPEQVWLPGSQGHSTLCLVLEEKPLVETWESLISAAGAKLHLYNARPHAWWTDVKIKALWAAALRSSENLPQGTSILLHFISLFPENFLTGFKLIKGKWETTKRESGDKWEFALVGWLKKKILLMSLWERKLLLSHQFLTLKCVYTHLSVSGECCWD